MDARRPRARSAARSWPAASSRSTAGRGGLSRRATQCRSRPAPGDRGPRRGRGVAAGAAWRRSSSASPSSSAATATALARRTPAATLAAGGKRLRPMLVLLCAGPEAGRGGDRARRPRSSWSTWRPWSTTTSSTTRRCAAASRPWSRASGRERGDGGRRPALLARLRASSRRRRGGRRQVALLARRPRSASPQGELAQRRDAFDAAIGARALPRALPAEDGAPVRVRLPDRPRRHARRSPRRGAERRSAREIGLAFQLLDDVLDVTRPAGADRQGARHRPARRHRHPAADPRPRARPRAGRARPARARRRARPRMRATGSRRPACSTRSARERRERRGAAKRRSRDRRHWTSSARAARAGRRRGRRALLGSTEA